MPKTKALPGLYNKRLNDAIRDIYRVYGSNLGAFFRDVEDPVGYGERKIEFYGRLTTPPRSKQHQGNPSR